MRYSLPDSFKIIESNIIDWYDAIVTGLVRIEGFHDWLFVKILAVDFETKEKVYLVLRMTDSFAKEYIELLHSDQAREYKWESINSLNKRFVDSYSEDMYLGLCEDLDSGFVTIRRVDSGRLNLNELVLQKAEDSLTGHVSLGLTRSTLDWRDRLLALSVVLRHLTGT